MKKYLNHGQANSACINFKKNFVVPKMDLLTIKVKSLSSTDSLEVKAFISACCYKVYMCYFSSLKMEFYTENAQMAFYRHVHVHA